MRKCLFFVAIGTVILTACSGGAGAQESNGANSGMSGGTWLWAGVLVIALWAAQWGAEHLAEPLKKLRSTWGFSEVAGAAFVGLAAASPEIGINVTSAVRGVSNIGLGTMLGSNVLAIPLVVTVAYWATRKRTLGDEVDGKEQGDHPHHQHHLEENLLRIRRDAIFVQAAPYLLLVGLVALLTVPAAWRGLQPVDGWIMLGAYLLYLAQALLRGREERSDVSWSRKEVGLAVAGVVALAVGAYFTVRSTENLVSAFGISEIIGGLFITAPMAALPEIFAVRSVTRSGQVTAATSSVIGDHAVTMSVAFLPLALVAVPVDDLQLFSVNLIFVALMPLAYAILIHWGAEQDGFKRWQVLLLDGIYLLYLALIVFWVLNLF